jgi:DNA-binding FadR family transcriptional regulator
MVSMIRGQLTRVLKTVLLLPDARPRSTDEHAQIAKALRRRNPEAGRKAMHAHLSSAIKRYEAAQQAAATKLQPSTL